MPGSDAFGRASAFAVEGTCSAATAFASAATRSAVRKAFARLVRRIGAAGVEVDVIATSPLVRARETAEILAEELGGGPRVEVVDALAPSADWEALVEWTVQQDAERVAWVGHAPSVGRLVALTVGDGTAAVRMQKGAVAAIRLDDGPGQPGELEWLVTPAFAD